MDFRELFQPGINLYYVKINELTGNKEIVYGRVRTVYEKALILTDDEDQSSHVVDISEADYLFMDEHTAKECLKNTQVNAKYGGAL